MQSSGFSQIDLVKPPISKMPLAQFSWRDRYGEKNEPEKGAAMHIFVGKTEKIRLHTVPHG